MAVLLMIGFACNGPPQWVVWTYRHGLHAQSEHQTLAGCHEAAKRNPSPAPGRFFGPRCLAKGVKP
jgi:hypothetical protein